MRVLELRQSLRHGGLERLLVQTGPPLRRLGVETSILLLYNRSRARLVGDEAALPERHPLLDEAAELGVAAWQAEDPGVLSGRPLRAILRTVRAGSFDLLHTNDFKTNVLGLLAGRLTGTPTVASTHGYPRVLRRNAAYRRLDLWALRLHRHVVCVSDALRRELLAEGLPPERLSVVHNGIDAAGLVAAAARTPQTLRRDLGLQADDLVVMSVGRLSEEKGHRYLLEAIRQAAAAQPSLACVIVGAGPLRARLHAQAHRLGIGGRVHFLGYRRDVPALLAQCDVLAHPSTAEALGAVVQEAMALARPVIGTTAGGVRELIVPGETGLLVPPADPGALGDAILELGRDPARGRRMGEAGRARVLAEFSVERMAAGLAEVFGACARSRALTTPRATR